MNILITTFGYFPDRSGVPAVAQYLAEGLSKMGHNISVATALNGNEVPEYEVINNVQVYRFNIGLSPFKRIVGDVQGYVNFIKSQNLDFIIMECLLCDTTDALLSHLQEFNCKVLIHAHGAPWIKMKPFTICDSIKHTVGNTYNWIRWQLYKSGFKDYSKNIAASISCSICATDFVYFSKLIKHNYVLENSASEMFFEDTNNADVNNILGIKNSRYIVNIATFCDRKNQSFLIDAFVKANINGVSLVLIGTDRNNYYHKLIKQIQKVKKLGDFDIVLLDSSIKRDVLPIILKHASLFAMSSKWEEYPISLVEAMACGTPFLSTPAGNAHILPGGITSRNNDEYPILLRALLNDAEYLNRLSIQGYTFSHAVNKPDKVISKLNTILINLKNE